MTSRGIAAILGLLLVAGACGGTPPSRHEHRSGTPGVRVVINRTDGPRGANDQIVVEGGRSTMVRSRGRSIGVFGSEISDSDEREIVQSILAAERMAELPQARTLVDHPAMHYTLDADGRHVEVMVTPETTSALSAAYGRATAHMQPLRAFRIELSDVDRSPSAGEPTTARVVVVNVGTEAMTLALSRAPSLWVARPPKAVPKGMTPIGSPPLKASPDGGAVAPVEIDAGERHEIDLQLEVAEPGEYGVWATWEGVFKIAGGGANPVEAWGSLTTPPVTIEVEP